MFLAPRPKPGALLLDPAGRLPSSDPLTGPLLSGQEIDAFGENRKHSSDP